MLRASLNLIPFLLAAASTVAEEGERTRGVILFVGDADHSHTLTIAGYSARGNPILGYAAGEDGNVLRDAAGVAYTTLGYANGPGARRPETELDPTDPDYRQRATHPMLSETHAGEDVPAYATGPGADGVRGVMNQHELHAVMRAALFGKR